MIKFYINDEKKVFAFSKKKQDLICLGELLGETAEQLYWRSFKASYSVCYYDKRFGDSGCNIEYPQIYDDFKKCLSRYSKSFKSILRSIDEYKEEVRCQ